MQERPEHPEDTEYAGEDGSAPKRPLRRIGLLLQRHVPLAREALARGAGLAFALQAGGAGLGYATQVLLARWMRLPDYGAYVYAVSWATLLAALGGLGFYTAVLRFVPQYHEAGTPGLLGGFLLRSRQLVFAAGCGLALLATLVLVLLRGLTPGEMTGETALLAGFWAAPVLALVRWCTEALRARKRIGWAYGTTRVLRPALVLGTASLLALLPVSLSAPRMVGVYVLALLLVLGVQGGLVRRAFAGETAAPQYATQQWLSVALPLFLVAGTLLLRAKTDLLLIGLLMPPEQVGIYNAALQTSYVVLYGSLAVDAVAAPDIAAAHARDEPRALPQLARRLAHWYFWPTLAAVVLVGLFSGRILSLFGPAFAAGRPVVFILLGALLVNAGVGPVKHLLHLTGHERRSLRVLLSTLLLNAVLNLAGISLLGLPGAALATALSLIARDLWLYRLVRTHLHLNPSIVAALRS